MIRQKKLSNLLMEQTEMGGVLEFLYLHANITIVLIKTDMKADIGP